MKPQWSFSSTEKNKNKTKNLPINTGIKTSNLCRTEKGNIKYIKKKKTLNWNYEKHKMSDFYHVLNMRSDFLFLITSFCLALFYCKGLMPPHCWNRSLKAVSTMCREFHFLLKVVFFFSSLCRLIKFWVVDVELDFFFQRRHIMLFLSVFYILFLHV